MPAPAPTPASTQAPKRVLPVIVLAQLLGTSPWFAVNAVMPDLQAAFGWSATAVGALTSALQGGFIVGTLVFALLGYSDRFSARRLFLVCAVLAALCTLGAWISLPSLPLVWMWRALTGFFLAGIYPVGMKLAAMWFPHGLGSALGWLIGALVLGSASPHALRGLSAEGASGAAGWTPVFVGVAGLTALAGLLLIALVPEPAKATGTAGSTRTTQPAGALRRSEERRVGKEC